MLWRAEQGDHLGAPLPGLQARERLIERIGARDQEHHWPHQHQRNAQKNPQRAAHAFP